jgi:hypothetical protein
VMYETKKINPSLRLKSETRSEREKLQRVESKKETILNK